MLPLWKDETVVILASGPSLTQQHLGIVQAAHQLARCKVIAVNDTYLLAPWADAAYFSDSHWWKWQTDGIDKPSLDLKAHQVRDRWACFQGQKCTIQNTGANVTDDAVHMLRNKSFPDHCNGLSLDPRALVTGHNGGFQALNLATLSGALRLILCGYDAREPQAGESAHGLTGDHSRPTPVAAYAMYRKAMATARPALDMAGVTVLNCSPGSAINSFPMADLEATLQAIR